MRYNTMGLFYFSITLHHPLHLSLDPPSPDFSQFMMAVLFASLDLKAVRYEFNHVSYHRTKSSIVGLSGTGGRSGSGIGAVSAAGGYIRITSVLVITFPAHPLVNKIVRNRNG